MLRSSVCISSDSEDEIVAFDDWLDVWKDKLEYISDDYGCGCCVHLYDIEGPADAIDAIPKSIKSESKWTEKGIKSV